MIALGDYIDAGQLPPIIGLSLTPRGRHYLVPPAGQHNTTSLLPKVDYRGTGGYVLLPPSRTPDGTYWWDTPLTLDSATAAAGSSSSPSPAGPSAPPATPPSATDPD